MQLSLAKGYELGTLKRPTEVILEETGGVAAALSGPNHAEEVGRDMPSATVIACATTVVAGTCRRPSRATRSASTPTTTSSGRVLRRGQEPDRRRRRHVRRSRLRRQLRASLITRSVAEMTRLGMVQGAHVATFIGLAGIGDLIATCTSRHSRNRLAGELLAKGASPAEVEAEIGQVVEGIPTAYALHDLAGKLGIEMPVTENVYQVLEGSRTPQECVADLMGRTPGRNATRTPAGRLLRRGRRRRCSVSRAVW